jgi:uncharacterized protein YdeI (BOF family)
MKKFLSIVLACILVMGIFSFAFAEENKTDKTKEAAQPAMTAPGMMGQMGMMDKGKMMGMAAMMMVKSMVATSDGGVVVLVGNKIQKYDKDLALQKEVEIKMDSMGAQKMMAPMAGKCADGNCGCAGAQKNTKK